MLVTDILHKSPCAARGSEKRCYQVANLGLLDVVMMPVDVLHNQLREAGKKIASVLFSFNIIPSERNLYFRKPRTECI